MAAVAMGAGAVAASDVQQGETPADLIDHSDHVGAPHAPRSDDSLGRQREGRVSHVVAPLTVLSVAFPSTVWAPPLLGPGRRFVVEFDSSRADVACTSDRTSRGPPAFDA